MWKSTSETHGAPDLISTQVTAGSRMYLLNIQKREARGPLIALGAAGKNLVRGAFGGRFDLHVRIEKAEKPPVVWVCGANDELPAVGPWTPPQPRAAAPRSASCARLAARGCLLPHHGLCTMQAQVCDQHPFTPARGDTSPRPRTRSPTATPEPSARRGPAPPPRRRWAKRAADVSVFEPG